MKKATLSVIIPVYNVEKYVRRCLDSVLNQTYPVHEIICVDDGSTDDSLKILNEYRHRDERILVMHKDNGGLVSARKAGIAIATGEYISNIDSDDYIEKEMYNDLMVDAVKNDADIITSGLMRDYGNHIVIENEEIQSGIYEGDKLIEEVLERLVDRNRFFKANLSVHITNKIFKRELLLSVQKSVNEKIVVGEDVAVVYPCLFKANRIIVSGKNYYHYCVRSDSVMAYKENDNIESLQLLFKHLKKAAINRFDKSINEQLVFLENYVMLLRQTSRVLHYEDGVLYPFGSVDKMQRIVLYGAGKFGSALRHYFEENGFNIVAWVDRTTGIKGVVTPEKIRLLDFDVVIVGVLVADTVENIKKELLGYLIGKNVKILSVDVQLIKIVFDTMHENRHMVMET